MNRDTTIIQVSVLMIAIAILGIAVWRQQNPTTPQPTKQVSPLRIQEQVQQAGSIEASGLQLLSGTAYSGTTHKPLTERENPDRANLVKQYFMHIAAKDFQKACALMSSGKCSAIRPAAVESFTQEFLKLKNGYEYLQIKDYGFQSPSGKDVVCVKYSYRYKDDSNPGLISEVMSYYIEEDVGKRVISDRVCEKKYKEGSGNRPCPVEAIQKFCVGKVK